VTTPRSPRWPAGSGDWHTVWEAIKPLLDELVDDPERLARVDTVGVDEHIVRREALLFSDGCERPSSPCRRSGGVKLAAA